MQWLKSIPERAATVLWLFEGKSMFLKADLPVETAVRVDT
jgi:hypothetical protein